MTATPRKKMLVVGLGNLDRGDDGVGPLVAKKLAGLLPADVAVVALGGDVLNLIATWAGFDAVICIDAATAATAPGRIHRFDLAASEWPRELASISSPASSHAFGLAETVALARALRKAPRDIVVYAIEGACFGAGAALTPAVAAAAAEVAGRVVAEVARLRACTECLRQYTLLLNSR